MLYYVAILWFWLLWPIYKMQWKQFRAKRNAVKQRKVLVEEAEEYLRTKR